MIASDVEVANHVCRTLQGLADGSVDCEVAADRQQALAASERLAGSLALVILDLPLDSAGLSLLSELRMRCPLSERMVIAADLTAELAVAALEHGASAYLRKPFSDFDLLRAARTGLGKSEEMRRCRGRAAEVAAGPFEIVDAIPAFLLALDEQRRILIWNRRLEQTTGFMREEMLGKPGGDVGDADGDRKLVLKSGEQRMVRWRHTEVIGVDGRRVRYALGVDVTDEQSMLRRTLRAERLAAAGTLATGLAHELRNPLNSAKLQLQVLRRRLERSSSVEEVGPVLSLVEDELGRLERLTSDFLAFAQPRPSVFKRVKLGSIVRRIADAVSAELEQRGIALETSLDEGTGWIEAAPEQLGQALLNLVRNSIEAMDDHGVLRLATHPADGHGRVAISVEDTGSGLPENAPIFDAFYTTKRGGTGLGLAIVHRIVADHGGSVGFESRPGRTLFTVYLPIVGAGSAGG